MTKKEFRLPKMNELKEGLPIWLNGKSFENTRNLFHGDGDHQICGPFLIERILFRGHTEPRIDIMDPETGKSRSMLSSWLLVPKEKE